MKKTLVALLAALCLPLSAAAQPGPASTSAPPDAVVRAAAAPAWPAAWSPEVYGRYVTVPDAIVGSLFSTRTQMHSWAVGAGVRWRWLDDAEWRFSVDWLQMGFVDGNWLEESQPAASASLLEWDLGFLSVAASHLWHVRLWGDRLDLVLGVGAAVGVFVGDVYATDVVPTCTQPVADCVAWRRVTRRALSLPTRVLGLPIATVGLDWRVVSALTLRVEGGLYGVPYAGGALAWGL